MEINALKEKLETRIQGRMENKMKFIEAMKERKEDDK